MARWAGQSELSGATSRTFVLFNVCAYRPIFQRLNHCDVTSFLTSRADMTSTAAAPTGSDLRSTAEIRALFPALERRHGGHPVAYFDGPGGTQVPRAVAEAVRDYLLHHNANTHWHYPTSEETDRILGEARASLGDFLGATPAEIVFGANMTTLTFHLGRALGRGWGPGDELIVTELDHHANVAPWRALERERGLVSRVI